MEHVDAKDAGKPVALIAKMTGQKPLAVQLVSKGLLHPNRMRRLLDRSSPKEVIMDALIMLSDLARMDKVTHPSYYIPLLIKMHDFVILSDLFGLAGILQIH